MMKTKVSGTSIAWSALDDERIKIEIDSPLASAPGILKNLEKSIRLMAQTSCPEELVAADAVYALVDEMVGRQKGEEG
jgi:hypothetical protein